MKIQAGKWCTDLGMRRRRHAMARAGFSRRNAHQRLAQRAQRRALRPPVRALRPRPRPRAPRRPAQRRSQHGTASLFGTIRCHVCNDTFKFQLPKLKDSSPFVNLTYSSRFIPCGVGRDNKTPYASILTHFPCSKWATTKFENRSSYRIPLTL